jgi:hypothetical protein
MLTMLFSGAWWAQRLTGITAQAVTVAVAAAVMVGSIVGGLSWLRHDARSEERAGWVARLANARVQDLARLRVRERQAETIGAEKATEWAAQLSASEATRVELEAKLVALKADPVCWPKGIVGDLNR